MIHVSETAGPAARLRKPYQFTVRTFFAAAVWLSLLLAAVKTLQNGAMATAVAFLAWIAFGALYRRFRAVGPLVALGGGPVLLLMVWGVVLTLTGARSHGVEVLPPVSWFLIYAFAWAVALSLAVVIERGVERLLRRRACRARRHDAGEAASGAGGEHLSGQLRCAAILLGMHTLVALTGLAGSVRTSYELAIVLPVIVVVDLPVVPLYILMVPAAFGSDYRLFFLASLVVGGAFYAVVGLAIPPVVDWIRNRGTRSREGCPSVDSGPTDVGREP
jgi:hypothetical protein